MTETSAISNTGIGLLKTWCGQARIVANESSQDERGWDVFLQLSSTNELGGGPLNRLPPGLSCMVQVKTTTSSDRSVAIKLSNWRYMCSDPMPWFVLAIQLKPATLEFEAAYLVHIGEDWCAKALRRLREASAEANAEVNRLHLTISWSEDDRLSQPIGDGLAARIRKTVGEQGDYVAEKSRWFRDLGYEDRARTVTLSIPSDGDATMRHFADMGIGLVEHMPSGWSAAVTDVRFGVEGELSRFDATAGEMEFRAPAQGELELALQSSSGKTAKVAGPVYRARAVFPFLPERFDQVRVAAAHVSVILLPSLGTRAWTTFFRFSMPQEPTTVAKLRSVVEVASLLLNNDHDPITLIAGSNAASVKIRMGSGEPLDPQFRQVIEVLDAALWLCSAFDVPTDALVFAPRLDQQAAWVNFMKRILSAAEDQAGELVAPYREVVPVGTMFGVLHEAVVELEDRRLGLFIGAYGIVTECREVPGRGAQVRAAEGRMLTQKCSVFEDTDDAEIDAIRRSVAAALEAKGCTHILLPEEHRALVEGRPGAAPDVGGSTTV